VTAAADATEPLLSVRVLTKTFHLYTLGGAEIRGCDGVSFELAPGRFLALTGPSGAGKSTVLKCIYRTYLPTGGQIRYRRAGGAVIDLARAGDSAILALRRSEIGYVSQFLRVVPRVTVVDVVAEGLWNIGWDPAPARDAAREMLGALRIPRELWNVAPATFSGGEQQRVNLARAFVLQPRLLLLDEPIASLDTAAIADVAALLRRYKASGTSMIGVFHNTEPVQDILDGVVRMHHGIGEVRTAAPPA
jgi:alpha-D-ribose 1-methylphosphonate 5-triphosphate synthase subunit PhnL